MNKNVYMMLLILFALQSNTIKGTAQWIEHIKSFFNRRMIEKIDQKEFAADSIDTVCIINTNGSITVKTGPKKSLFVRTITRVKKNDDLDAIGVAFDESKKNNLVITTKKKKNKNKSIGSIDYELIVPASINLALTITGKGTVCIKDVQGTIDVTAQDTVSITNTKKLVSAQTFKKGTISVVNAHGPIEAYTQQGMIIGENIAHNFNAESISGKIDVTYKNLPPTSSVDLCSASGNITLALPTTTHAEICGQTTNGTLISEHEIKLNSRTTKLNKVTWAQFTRDVDGTLGNGDASIALRSNKGNIKILTIS